MSWGMIVCKPDWIGLSSRPEFPLSSSQLNSCLFCNLFKPKKNCGNNSIQSSQVCKLSCPMTSIMSACIIYFFCLFSHFTFPHFLIFPVFKLVIIRRLELNIIGMLSLEYHEWEVRTYLNGDHFPGIHQMGRCLRHSCKVSLLWVSMILSLLWDQSLSVYPSLHYELVHLFQ